MQKILILGAGGMLGHMVLNYFLQDPQYQIIHTTYRTQLPSNTVFLDVKNIQSLNQIIDSEQPDFIINCIGALIRESQQDKASTLYLNAFLPNYLAQYTQKTNIKLIHISTDCVFSGQSTGGYVEEDKPDAIDLYGISKALGEISNNKDITLRTSIIGPELKTHGEGLFNWFVHQNNAIDGYTKMIWGGVTTLQLVKVIKQAIEQDLTGLVHVTNTVPISKFDLLQKINRIWGLDIDIRAVEGKSINKSLASRFDLFAVPSYEDMLYELHEWMQGNRTFYEDNYGDII